MPPLWAAAPVDANAHWRPRARTALGSERFQSPAAATASPPPVVSLSCNWLSSSSAATARAANAGDASGGSAVEAQTAASTPRSMTSASSGAKSGNWATHNRTVPKVNALDARVAPLSTSSNMARAAASAGPRRGPSPVPLRPSPRLCSSNSAEGDGSGPASQDAAGGPAASAPRCWVRTGGHWVRSGATGSRGVFSLCPAPQPLPRPSPPAAPTGPSRNSACAKVLVAPTHLVQCETRRAATERGAGRNALVATAAHSAPTGTIAPTRQVQSHSTGREERRPSTTASSCPGTCAPSSCLAARGRAPGWGCACRTPP